MGAQVDLGLGLAVQDACPLGEQVANGLIVSVVLEERFVGSHDLGILLEPLPYPGTQLDDPLNPLGRQEGITDDLVGLLADPVDAAGSLDQTDDGPGKVVIDDDRPILKVLALAQNIRCHQHSQLPVDRHLVALAVAVRAETPGDLRRVVSITGDPRHSVDPTGFELILQVDHRVRELSEDDHLLFGVLAGDKVR